MVIVIAMLVVVMDITVVMGMIVRGMFMPGMPMHGLRRMSVTARIGTAFGIERRLDLDDARAQPLHHRLDDVIAANAQALRHDLRRQVAIAEMPGDPNQMQGIDAPDLDQRLGSRDHLDQTAVFEHQRIAATQRDGMLQVEQELQPARPGHRHPPPVPVVEIEHDRVGG